MPLPVLSQHALTSDSDLLRRFQRTERLWAEHLGEIEQLDAGVAVTNPDLPGIHDANRMLEAALPPGQTPQQVFEEVHRHFDSKGVTCWKWQLSFPGSQGDATAGLGSYLQSLGYRRETVGVMALGAAPAHSSVQSSEGIFSSPALHGISVLPTRAAFRQARELAEEQDASGGNPARADAQMLHLDDPHCDSLLALREGKAVGRVTVLAVGDVGRIEQLYVSKLARGQGIGRLLIDRALEICARSLFRHVLLSVAPANTAATSLYQQFGFRKIGEVASYCRP